MPDKLMDFLPTNIRNMVDSPLNGLVDFFTFMQKSVGGGRETYRMPPFGVEQLAHQWIQKQIANRSAMIQDLFTIAFSVAEIRTVVTNIRNEVFRRGIEFEPKFAVKCKKCKKEYQTLTEKCPKCGSENFLVPNEKQLERFNEFKDCCNIWDQSLEDVLRQSADDANIADDLFIFLSKSYVADGKGGVRSRVEEVQRLHPALVEFDFPMGSQGQIGVLPKSAHFICMIHREKQVKDKPGKCDECGLELTPVMYRYIYGGKPIYLIESEVIHETKFTPSQMYGYSPVLTIFEKALTLIGMDKTLYRYFWERKMPAALIVTSTDDPEGLRRERQDVQAQMAMNPDYLPWIASSAKTGRGRTDLVRLFHTLQEMDYLPVKNEIRERIGMMWGMPPLWQGSLEGIGGISAQTQQLTVASRVVESDQRLYNEKVFPQLLNSFGITDWVLKLQQPEEKAEQTRIQFASQRTQTANMLFQMGFDIELQPGVDDMDDIKFKVSGKAKKPEQPSFGGFGAGLPEPEQGGEPEEEEPSGADFGESSISEREEANE